MLLRRARLLSAVAQTIIQELAFSWHARMITWDREQPNVAKACEQAGIALIFGNVRAVGGVHCGFSKEEVEQWRLRSRCARLVELGDAKPGGSGSASKKEGFEKGKRGVESASDTTSDEIKVEKSVRCG